jgi:hypothetical protein
MLSGSRQTARSWRFSGLALIAGLIVAACSGSAAATPAASAAPMPTVAAATATPTPLPTAAPTKGPATQNFVLGGPAGEAGAVTLAAIRCNLPLLSGTQPVMEISVLARPADPNLSVYIFVQQGKVDVRYDSGAGSTYDRSRHHGRPRHTRRADLDQRHDRLRQSDARLLRSHGQRIHA